MSKQKEKEYSVSIFRHIEQEGTILVMARNEEEARKKALDATRRMNTTVSGLPGEPEFDSFVSSPPMMKWEGTGNVNRSMVGDAIRTSLAKAFAYQNDKSMSTNTNQNDKSMSTNTNSLSARNVKVVDRRDLIDGVAWSVGNKEVVAWTCTEEEFPFFLGNLEEGEPVDKKSLPVSADVAYRYRRSARIDQSIPIRWIPCDGSEPDESDRDAFVRAFTGADIYVTVTAAVFSEKRNVYGTEDSLGCEALGEINMNECGTGVDLRRFVEDNFEMDFIEDASS